MVSTTGTGLRSGPLPLLRAAATIANFRWRDSAHSTFSIEKLGFSSSIGIAKVRVTIAIA